LGLDDPEPSDAVNGTATSMVPVSETDAGADSTMATSKLSFNLYPPSLKLH